MKKVLICDTETTGVLNNPATGAPDVIELAYLDVTDIPPKLLVETPFNIIPKFQQLYYPMIDISPEAYNVHKYKKADLVGQPSSIEVKLPETSYLIGHNINYDYRCMQKPEGVQLICTLALYRALKKARKDINTVNDKLDTLIAYFFPEYFKDLPQDRHVALEDCKKVYFLLRLLTVYFPKVHTWEDMFLLQQELKKLSK